MQWHICGRGSCAPHSLASRCVLILSLVSACLTAAAVAAEEATEAASPNTAVWYGVRGTAHLSEDHVDQAIDDLSAAIRLAPEASSSYLLRAGAYNARGDYEAALSDLRQVLVLDPTATFVHVECGLAFGKLGRYREAFESFDTAIDKAPNLSRAYAAKAMLLSTCPDDSLRNGKEALRYATLACELAKDKKRYSQEALAAAYAECGEWESAIDTQSRALKLATEARQRTVSRARLKLYEAHEPYRQTAEGIERDRLAGSTHPLRINLIPTWH